MNFFCSDVSLAWSVGPSVSSPELPSAVSRRPSTAQSLASVLGTSPD